MRQSQKAAIDLVSLALASSERRPESLPDSNRSTRCLTPTELASLSDGMLQNVMLSRHNLAANLRQKIGEEIEFLAEQIADAKVAEMLLEMRRKGRKRAPRTSPPKAAMKGAGHESQIETDVEH